MEASKKRINLCREMEKKQVAGVGAKGRLPPNVPLWDID